MKLKRTWVVFAPIIVAAIGLVVLAVRHASRGQASVEWTQHVAGRQVRSAAELPAGFSQSFRAGFDETNRTLLLPQEWSVDDVRRLEAFVDAARKVPRSSSTSGDGDRTQVDPLVETDSLAVRALGALTERLGHDGPMTVEAREAALHVITAIATDGPPRVRRSLPSCITYTGLVFQYPHLMDMLRSLTNDPDPEVAKNAGIHLNDGVPRVRARWEATLAERSKRDGR